MSYLLDALKKSKGEQPSPSDYNEVPQPVMYPSYAPEPQTNIYKWISIVLALILTLIVGIVLGNKYALLGVPESKPIQPQAVVTPTQPVTAQPVTAQPITTQQQTAKAEPQTQESNTTETKPATKAQTEQQTAKVATVTSETNNPTSNQLAQNQQSQQTAQQEPQEVLEGEPQIVGYQPETIDTDGKLKNTGGDAISSDLLSKFHQAIADTEGTEELYQQQQAQQTDLHADLEVDGYLTRVPRIVELKPSQQMQIPAMTYETHLYSSDRFNRWVKINGRTMQETQWVTEDIQIYEIQRQFLILDMGHIRFSLPALTDWPGYGK